MDVFSRFCQLRVCRNSSADEIFKKIQESLPFFAPNNKYTSLCTDRGSEYGKGLGKRLGLRHYFLNTGNFRKVSILERQIRSWKAIFFRYLLKFPTIKNYQHIIHLTQIAFNSSKHRGLYQLTPHFVHHFDYAASLVLRKSLRDYKSHQSDAFLRYQSLHENKRLKLHDVVRIRYPKKLIRKESSVFYPQTSEKTYRITKISTAKIPYVYFLDDDLTRRYYGWNLMRVNPITTTENIRIEKEMSTNHSTSRPIIVVKNIIPGSDHKLRSGRMLLHPFEMTYDTLKNGVREFVDANTLKLYKRLFGQNILQYDQLVLDNPDLKKHII